MAILLPASIEAETCFSNCWVSNFSRLKLDAIGCSLLVIGFSPCFHSNPWKEACQEGRHQLLILRLWIARNIELFCLLDFLGNSFFINEGQFPLFVGS